MNKHNETHDQAAADRSAQLGARYQLTKEQAQQGAITAGTAGVPPPLAPDERDFWGRPRESAEQRRHHQKMKEIAFVAREAGYTAHAGAELEEFTLNRAIDKVEAMEQRVLRTEPGTVAAQLAEELFVACAGRLKRLSTRVSEDFQRKTL